MTDEEEEISRGWEASAESIADRKSIAQRIIIVASNVRGKHDAWPTGR